MGGSSILVLKEHIMGMTNYISAFSSASAGRIMKHVSYLTGVKKGKTVPFQTVKAYMGSRGIAPSFLTSALDAS